MTFVIYDSTGTIQKSFQTTADQKNAIALNTPTGMSALQVPANSPAIINQSAWKVQNGQLISAT